MRDDQMHASNVRIFIESGKAPDEKGKTIQNAKYKKFNSISKPMLWLIFKIF